MRRKARTICKLCKSDQKIQVGQRSIHLVEKHRKTPPKKWLEKHGLPEHLEAIADAMKKDRKLRPLYRWIYEYFDSSRRE